MSLPVCNWLFMFAARTKCIRYNILKVINTKCKYKHYFCWYSNVKELKLYGQLLKSFLSLSSYRFLFVVALCCLEIWFPYVRNTLFFTLFTGPKTYQSWQLGTHRLCSKFYLLCYAALLKNFSNYTQIMLNIYSSFPMLC